MSGSLEEYTNKVIEEFDAISKDAVRVQRETLKQILEDNASAEYLMNLGLNGRTDPETFKAIVPVVSHNDLLPYINRIVGGEKSPILTRKPITQMTLSSGTTQGKSKYIPWSDSLMEELMLMLNISFAYRNRVFPVKSGMALCFDYGSKKSESEEGMTICPVSVHVLSNENYNDAMAEIYSQSASPQEVLYGSSDFHQSLYCHLLSGLIFKDQINQVYSGFAYTIVQAFKTFEQVWEELCNDIRGGILSSRVSDPLLRTAMSKILKPDPELANLIHKKCEGLNNWYGMIPELFPNVKYVLSIMTGSMQVYVNKLRHYAGEVPLVSSDYLASEGIIGTNIHPTTPHESVSYTLFPHTAYFEFIPITENSTTSIDPKPVDISEVKVGEEYEIVLTTRTGLYRYKLGDVVKITGFYNSTPELKFIRRRTTLLSIYFDKITENDLYLAMVRASEVLAKENVSVIDYTSHVDLSKVSGNYVIFIEINNEASEEVLGEYCTTLDKSLLDGGYVYCRRANTIGPLEVRVVKNGTFKKVLDHFVEKGGSAYQFKIPRCITTTSPFWQILNENVHKSYISTAFN